MPEFIISPQTITGEQYTPGHPCPGVLELTTGRAVIPTQGGLIEIAAGACVYPDPAAPGFFLSKPAHEFEALQVRALKEQMTAIFESLPVELRAIFRPTKTAVLDAINDNCLDEVQLLIRATVVPAEHERAKAALLALLA